MIIGLIVFAFYLYFFVGFDKIFLVVQNVNLENYLTFYSLALAVMVGVMVCWAISWGLLLRALGAKIGFRNAFLYYWAGYFIDLIVPCQQICGEITRLYLVRTETKHNYGVLGAAGLANRIISYSIVTVGLSAGLIYLLLRNRIPSFASTLLILSWIGAVVYLSVLLYLALKADAADKLASAIFRFLKALRIKRYRQQDGLSPGLLSALKSFHEGIVLFRGKPKHLILPIVLQSIAYGFSLIVYIFIFNSLGLTTLLFDFFIVVYFLAGAIQDAASVFSVGGLEIILTNLFIFFGIDPATSGVSATVLRSAAFWFPVVTGYIIVQIIGARKLLNPEVREKLEKEQQKEIAEKQAISRKSHAEA